MPCTDGVELHELVTQPADNNAEKYALFNP